MQNTLDLDKIADEALRGVEYKALIGGKWRSSDTGKTFPVTNPATGEKLADVPECGSTETLAAIDAAAAALPMWAAIPAPTRADMLRKVAALMLERRERLATIMTIEQGKPLAEARGEIAYAASFLTWFA